MRRLSIGSLTVIGILLGGGIALNDAKQREAAVLTAIHFLPGTKLRVTRQSPFDLEIGGELAGLQRGATRYFSREDLLALPQVTYTVTDDPNFKGPMKISGVHRGRSL